MNEPLIWQTNAHTTFQYNADFYGDLLIQDMHGNQVVIPAQDVLDLVAWCYIARQKIARVEQATTDELLLGEIGNKKRKMESR